MYRVLIVDDDTQILRDALEIFKGTSFKAHVAANGRIACEIVKSTPIDLIVVDWCMPIMNGIETIKHLKSDIETELIPIIMLTGKTSVKHVKKAFKTGVIEFLKKPIDYEELLIRCKAILKQNERVQSSAKKAVKHFKKEKDKNVQIENLLEVKSKQLDMADLQLSHKKKSISRVSEILSSYMREDSPIKKSDLEEILKRFDLISDYEISQKKEELNYTNFSLIHQLKDHFPNLTQTELQICSMIHMNLTNKHIANLLCVSTRTVENHRYNISKKVQLSKGERLNDYIGTFI